MSQITDSIDWPLLERYLAGECSPSERAAFETWLAGAPDRRAYVESIRGSVDAWRAARPVAGDVEDALAGVLATTRAPSRRSNAAWRLPTFLIASAAAIAIALVALVHRPQQQFREFATAPGSRSTVVLRDGTRLMLGPSTHLRVASDFGRTTREVTLDGEAMFTVVHDNKHPFAVHAGQATVMDIGTEFDVRAYAADAGIRVGVVVGAASVRPARGSGAAILRAGDMATIAGTRFTVMRHADLSALTAWVQGGLAFQATPLPDVVRQLARTYNLDITLADSSLATEAITATFNNEPADQVLDAITRIIGARYERNGRRIVIRRQGTTIRDHAPGASPAPLRTVEKTTS